MSNYLQNNNSYDLFDAFNEFFKPTFYDETKEMRTNVKEDEHNYEVDVEMPGYQKEDIKISLQKGYLTVSAKKQEKEANGKRYLRREISETCQRSYYVGMNVAQEDIKAKFDNGILSLVVPKEQKKQPEEKYIAIE